MAVIERDNILKGLTPIERDLILQGITSQSFYRSFILRGSTEIDHEKDSILKGKDYSERNAIIDTKLLAERDFLLNAYIPNESLVVYEFTEDEIQDLTITSGELINEVTINYAYDFEENKPLMAITKHNPVSKLLYGEARQSYDMPMIQTSRLADRIADAILLTSSNPSILCACKHNLKSIHIEVGDIVSLTHRAGLGENGFQKAIATITRKRLMGISIEYELTMKPDLQTFHSELLTLTQASSAGKESITITYEQGVATITIYADIEGYPPVEGAEVTINSVKKVTDKNGQVRFNLEPGTYTAYIHASGYQDAEITFRV